MATENKTSMAVENLFRGEEPSLMLLLAIQRKYQSYEALAKEVEAILSGPHDEGDLEAVLANVKSSLAFDPL